MHRTIRSQLRTLGFTLLELMIVVVVVAILGAIAWPSFVQSIYKGRRSDGVGTIVLVQQELERWRSSQPAYPANLGAMGMADPLPSKDGYYSVVMAPINSGLGYQITATATGVQTNDTKCQKLMVQMTTGGIVYSSSDSLSATNSAANNPCWAR